VFNQTEIDKIALLIGNADLVYQIHELVHDTPDGIRKKSKRVSQPPIDRATELAIELKTYLMQMSAEADEYNDPKETRRLQSEAVGILLSLREIIRHFPELKQTLA